MKNLFIALSIISCCVIVFYAQKKRAPKYSIYCIDNISYLEINGQFLPHYSPAGEVQVCDLDEGDMNEKDL